MAERDYKYHREDFPPLPVKLDHLTIYLNFLEHVVEATNLLKITAKEPLDTVELDAKELNVIQVEWVDIDADRREQRSPLDYRYLIEKNKLIVMLPRPVTPGETFRIRTVTHCSPSDHILEGVYKDRTPPGAPQQYMSQCQQWGFQRIMPIFDDCRAKCTMTTTIEADSAYTHLISNGNVSRESNPD